LLVTLLKVQFRWQKVYIGERIDEAKDGVDRDSAVLYDLPDIHILTYLSASFRKSRA